jgi:hypothetical protein
MKPMVRSDDADADGTSPDSARCLKMPISLVHFTPISSLFEQFSNLFIGLSAGSIPTFCRLPTYWSLVCHVLQDLATIGISTIKDETDINQPPKLPPDHQTVPRRANGMKGIRRKKDRKQVLDTDQPQGK